MKLPRQPQPIKVRVSSSDRGDMLDAANMIGQYLTNRYDFVNRGETDEIVIFDCYPRAVND